MSQPDRSPQDPSDRQRLLEALEVCRAGRDDPADPALAPLAEELAARPELRAIHERLGRLDGVLAEAFRDVPVPEGLAERLLARLAEASRDSESPLVTRPEAVAGRGPVRRWRRRGWVAAVAASIALAGLVFYHLAPRPHSRDQVLDVAVELFRAAPAATGTLLSAAPADLLAKYPLDAEVVAAEGTRCRELDGFLGCPGVAYDLAGWGGARATLYVVRHEAEVLDLDDISPPGMPQGTTGGLAVAAWQRDGLLYVLVVQGNARDYSGFLNPGRSLT